MRIGVDAKWYFSGPPSTRTMLQNLLPPLFKFYPEHEWIVFLDRKDKQLGFPFHQSNIKIQYIWAGVNMLSNLLILPYHSRKYKPDIIIFQTFAALHRNRSIAFIHDVLFNNYPQFFTWKEKLYFLPLKWLTSMADRVVVTSQFVANELIRYNYRKRPNEIDIVPLGVSSDFKPADELDANLLQRVKEKFNLPDSFILFVGRLNVRKNIESLLKAIPLLHDTKIAVVIVGEEDGKTNCFKEILSNPKLQNRVQMTGNIGNEELPAIYAMATLFCFPSFAEGFGLPPLEAMAAGIPAVVSKTTSLPEVCGDAPVYIDSPNPESIASALNHLLEDPIMYQQKRKTGFEQARKYNWDKTAHRLMQSVINTINK